ncbi:ribonuclease H-like protein [Decorospora gaudefroyi]|uniref:Ribonuclease H-like protein n=1 Tax=Decorospora gaudefroyi TaxID=184978 RepID=A0A6A5KSN4_9PLEO|nr:ribonuclease H-like protein [Decorospora gaudefroyi]
MAPKPKSVTAKALQALLTRIGTASSGTKATLQDRFAQDLRRSRLVLHRPEWEDLRPRGRKLRMISIDMGIKNLAFCDAEISYPRKDSLDATMEVLRWEKIDLLSAKLDPQREDTVDMDEYTDPYSSTSLSKTAYWLVKDTILARAPDIILIEKQRWRSGSGSAIQQWTLRVNTLEGMLWAVLQTLYVEGKNENSSSVGSKRKNNYEVFAVDPKRVGQYWLAQYAGRLANSKASTAGSTTRTNEGVEEQENEATPKKKPSRTKAEKKVRIALLRSWLTSTPPSTAPTTHPTTPKISFKISENAASTLQSLVSPSKPTRRKKGTETVTEGVVAADEIGDTEIKKLDDITECFLQAAAWVSWESNRLQLLRVHDTKRGDGTELELDDETMLEMVNEVGEG